MQIKVIQIHGGYLAEIAEPGRTLISAWERSKISAIAIVAELYRGMTGRHYGGEEALRPTVEMRPLRR